MGVGAGTTAVGAGMLTGGAGAAATGAGAGAGTTALTLLEAELASGVEARGAGRAVATRRAGAVVAR
ncbi:MAG: hypothetical protein JWP92_221, partial [Caulobacter sp.]|nr:hypothetical protein [Caulobacter sp.]